MERHFNLQKMSRLIQPGLVLTFLICYVDFGHDGANFVGQLEYSLLKDIGGSFSSFQSPLFMLALIGQMLILFSMFSARSNKGLTITGLICLGIIVLLIFVSGLLTANLPVVLSTIPFIAVSAIYIVKRSPGKTEGIE